MNSDFSIARDVEGGSPRRPSENRMVGFFQARARDVVHRLMGGLRDGTLVLEEGSTRHVFGQSQEDPIKVHVHSAALYTKILTEGSLGAGRAWIEGDWSCDDLPRLLRLLLVQQEFVGPSGRMDSAFARLASLARTVFWPLRKNSRGGSRRNIAAHYDIGNGFYAAMLDPTMTYSSALFRFSGESLESAQGEKYDRLCRQLDLRAGHRVLEIGTGWGGFAMHAAKNYGCHVTTTTISSEQRTLAIERVQAAGLADRIEVFFKDYRDLKGRFDRPVQPCRIEFHLDKRTTQRRY